MRSELVFLYYKSLLFLFQREKIKGREAAIFCVWNQFSYPSSEYIWTQLLLHKGDVLIKNRLSVE